MCRCSVCYDRRSLPECRHPGSTGGKPSKHCLPPSSTRSTAQILIQNWARRFILACDHCFRLHVALAQRRLSLGVLQKTPSQLVNELTYPPQHVEGWRPKPKVVELFNIAEYTHQVYKLAPHKQPVPCSLLKQLDAQVASNVGLDEPLFQPFPPQVTFHNPELFKSHEALLYLRNNDKVRSLCTGRASFVAS